MSEYWEDIKTRGTQSVAVWREHDGDFKVGQLDVGAHEADVDQIATLVAARDAKGDLWDQAMDARDVNFAFMRSMNTRATAVMGGNFEPGDTLARELEDILGMRNDSTPTVMARARKVVILWGKVNEARAGATPELDPLQVGDKLAASLEDALTAHEDLLKQVQVKLSGLITARHTLRKHVVKVDQNNKRWYKAWAGNFEEGSVEKEALSQVTTGPEDTALPGAVTFTVIYDAEAGEFHADASAPHATFFRIYRKGPGDEEYVQRGSARTSPLTDPVTLPGEYLVKIQAQNSTGDGPMSAPQTVTVPEP